MTGDAVIIGALVLMARHAALHRDLLERPGRGFCLFFHCAVAVRALDVGQNDMSAVRKIDIFGNAIEPLPFDLLA